MSAHRVELMEMGKECPDCHGIMPVPRWMDGLEGVEGAELPNGHRCVDQDGRKVRIGVLGAVTCDIKFSENVAAGMIHSRGGI